MKHLRIPMVAALSTVLCAGLVACSAPNVSGGAGTEGGSAAGTVTASDLPESCSADTPLLGVSLPNTTNPYYLAMQDGFKETGRSLGFDVVVAIADDDEQAQLAQVDAFIQQDVCAVALNPISSGPSAAIVKALNDAGIPVFTVNVAVSQPDLDAQGAEVLQFIGADQEQGGRIMGELAVADFGDTPIVAGIIGFPAAVVTNQRDAGFTDALGSNGTVVSTVNGEVDPNVSLQVTTDLIQGNPEVNVIFSDTGPTTLGALKAIEQLGLTDTVALYGFCAADLEVSGAYKGCVAQEPYDYGKLVVENVRLFIDGDSIERTILRPLPAFGPGETPGPGFLG
jgi:ribose transport system substrate-binding protein